MWQDKTLKMTLINLRSAKTVAISKSHTGGFVRKLRKGIGDILQTNFNRDTKSEIDKFIRMKMMSYKDNLGKEELERLLAIKEKDSTLCNEKRKVWIKERKR